MKYQSLKIESIRRDSGAQFRDGLSKTHIEAMVEALADGATLPAISVFSDGENFWLVDGEHRIEAHIGAGRESIEARVSDGTQLDARRAGRKANAEHLALTRSRKAKRAAVIDALNDSDWAEWSNREIAKNCGVGESFVRQLISELESVTAFKRSDNRTFTDKHGNVSQMNTAKIGAVSAGDIPEVREVDPSEIIPIYDDPEFAAKYPVSILEAAGVDFERAAVEWFGIHERAEGQPLGPITIYPDGGFDGFWSVEVTTGEETKSTTKEPIPAQMLVAMIDSFGVAPERLREYRFIPIPAESRSKIKAGMERLITDAAEMGASIREAKEELSADQFALWVEAENTANGTIEGARLLMEFEQMAAERQHYSSGYLSGLAFEAFAAFKCLPLDYEDADSGAI